MCSYRHKKWILNFETADYLIMIFLVLIITLLGVNAYESFKNPVPIVDLYPAE